MKEMHHQVVLMLTEIRRYRQAIEIAKCSTVPIDSLQRLYASLRGAKAKRPYSFNSDVIERQIKALLNDSMEITEDARGLAERREEIPLRAEAPSSEDLSVSHMTEPSP
jgi:hypothetical protein